MNVILDACSIINLINGNVMELALKLPNITFHVGEDLLEEELLGSEQKSFIKQLLENGNLQYITYAVTISEYTLLRDKYGLGFGETMCLAQCYALDYAIITDDRKARRSACEELGEDNVFGSLFILRELFRKKFISCSDALNSFKAMKRGGGFLPNKDKSYFCN